MTDVLRSGRSNRTIIGKSFSGPSLTLALTALHLLLGSTDWFFHAELLMEKFILFHNLMELTFNWLHLSKLMMEVSTVYLGAQPHNLAYSSQKTTITKIVKLLVKNRTLSCQKDLSQVEWKAELKYGNRICKPRPSNK